MAAFLKKRWKLLLVLLIFIGIPVTSGVIGWRYVQRNYNGTSLARIIMQGFNKNRRGRLELTSVHWKPRAIFDFITGQPTRVVAKGLKIYDVRGKLVVDVPLASGYVHIEPLRKNMSLMFDDIHCDGGMISLEMFDSPDRPGRREIGLLGVFGSTKKKKEDKEDDSLPARSWVISARRFNLKNVTVKADMPSLAMEVRGMSLKGGHLYYGTRSLEDDFRFHLQGRPRAKVADVKFLGAQHQFREIRFYRGYMDPREPMNLHFALKAMEGDSPVTARAFLGDHGVTVDVHADKVGKIASRYIPLITLSDGPESAADIKIRGTIAEPIAHINGKGLRFLNPWGPSIDHLSGKMLFQRRDGYSTINFMEVSGNTVDATLVADGMWDLKTGNIFAKVKGVELDPREYVPPSVRDHFPHLLDGTVSVRTVFPDVRNVEFGWQMKGQGGTLNYLTSKGVMTYINGDVVFKQLRLAAAEVSARTVGVIRKDKTLSLRTTIVGHRMAPLLNRLGLPPMIRSAAFSGVVRGALADPSATGNFSLGGVQAKVTTLPSVHGFIKVNKQGASFSGVGGRLAGGRISGHGSANWTNGLWISGKGSVKRARLSQLTQKVASGELSAQGWVRGKVSSLSGKIALTMEHGSLAGMPIKDLSSEVKLKGGEIRIDKGDLYLSGAKVTVAGDLIGPHGLGLDLKVMGLNLDALRLQAVSGVLSAEMGLRGTITDPYIQGEALLEHASLHGTKVPSGAKIAFTRAGNQSLFRGNLFGKIDVNGTYALLPTPSSKIFMRFADMDPAIFFPPGFLKRYGLDMVLTGEGEGVLAAGRFPRARFVMKRALVGMTGIPNAFAPLRKRQTLSLGRPLTVTLDERGVTTRDLKVLGLGTDIDGTASYNFRRLKGKIDGDLGMHLVPYFLPPGLIEKATGSVSSRLAFTAGPDGVSLDGDLYFAGNGLYRSMGGEKITLRAGKLSFSPGKLTMDAVRVVYEEEELVAGGVLDLDQRLTPGNIEMTLRGFVSSKALFLVAPDALYSSTGRSKLDLTVAGFIKNPLISGTLRADEDNRIYLRSGREITVSRGSVAEFSGANVQLRKVRIDMEDGYVLLDGGFAWRNSRPVNTDITVKLRNLVERSASYEVEMMGDLQLTCVGSSPLQLQGTISLLNGSYKKKYNINLMDKLLTPVSRTSESSSGSSLSSVPWVRDMKLDLTIQLTGDIEVDNNFAQTKLEGVANVSGTVGSPAIGGVISLNGGSFRIPMLRGTYEIKEGIIDFDRAKQVKHSKDEPYLDVTGEMVFTDRLQNEHLITLKLHGFISQLKLNWSSSTGLSSSQVLMLLMLNRTPDEIRRGETGGIPDLGGMLEGLVPLNLQLGITSDSVKVYVDKKFMKEHLILRGNVEVGFMGRQMQEAFLIFRLSDKVSVQGKARRKVSDEETTLRENEDELQGRVELKYKIDLKGSWKDILGL